MLALLFAACESEPFAPPADELIVVQAFLYAGEPVIDVRLSEVIPLGSTDSVGAPITDARVTLVRNGVPYLLMASPGDSGFYHYPGTDLVVSEGDQFELVVVREGTTVTANTTVPRAPASISLSSSEVVRPTFEFGQFPDFSQATLTVHWDNPGGDLYFVAYRNIEADPDSVEDGGLFGGGFQRRLGRFMSQPTSGDSLTINAMSLTHYGEHEVKVYRVNTEYAQLYESRLQDTRDLNEPATNIQNGLGVFSAFASRRAAFRLLRE
jgi:hypothetical protein